MIRNSFLKTTYTKEYNKILDLLLNARKQAGLTQEDLAKLLHRPQSFVSKYERGERRLDVLEFAQISYALRISDKKIADLIKEIVSPRVKDGPIL